MLCISRPPIPAREQPSLIRTLQHFGRQLHPGPCASRLECRAAARQQLFRADQAAAAAAAESSPRSRKQQLAPATLALAACCAGAGLLQPGAALAAQSAEAAHEMYLISVGMGTTFTILTLLATSRFVMSFFPKLEKKARMRRLPWALFTLADPVLRPLQQGLFRMEPGDLDYGAVVLLATVTSVLETLVGDGGLILDKVPDPGVLHYLQYLVFFQHGLLLPSWTMVVLRFFCIV